MGPTVCELDGPKPILKRSKMLVLTDCNLLDLDPGRRLPQRHPHDHGTSCE
jgi:hypothetical protein